MVRSRVPGETLPYPNGKAKRAAPFLGKKRGKQEARLDDWMACIFI
jgi:hypothetical protein